MDRRDRWPVGAVGVPIVVAAEALVPPPRNAAGAGGDARPRHCADPVYKNSRNTNSCYGYGRVTAAASRSRTRRLTVLGLLSSTWRVDKYNWNFFPSIRRLER